MDDQRVEAMHISLAGIESMEDYINRFPKNYPKNDIVKLSIWAAHHFRNIYKILFFILSERMR